MIWGRTRRRVETMTVAWAVLSAREKERRWVQAFSDSVGVVVSERKRFAGGSCWARWVELGWVGPDWLFAYFFSSLLLFFLFDFLEMVFKIFFKSV